MMMESPKLVGQQIRAYRGYTISDMAKKVAASESTLKGILGRDDWPQYSKIAERFSCFARMEVIQALYPGSDLIRLHTRLDKLSFDLRDNLARYKEECSDYLVLLKGYFNHSHPVTNAHAARLYARILFDFEEYEIAEHAYERAVRLLDYVGLEIAAAKSRLDMYSSWFNRLPVDSRQNDSMVGTRISDLDILATIEYLAEQEPYDWRIMLAGLQVAITISDKKLISQYKKQLITSDARFSDVKFSPGIGASSIYEDPDIPGWLKSTW